MPAFSESDHLVLPGEKRPQPNYASALLSDLGVTDSPASAQEDAVRAWLDSHTPSTVLRASLDRAGLPSSRMGPQLVSEVARAQPPLRDASDDDWTRHQLHHARRRKLDVTWAAEMSTFTVARLVVVWAALGDRYPAAVAVFLMIDLITAVPYAFGTARLVTSLIESDVDGSTRWGALAFASFLAPYAWVAWVGRDGSLSSAVYTGLILCLLCFGSSAIRSVHTKVVMGRSAVRGSDPPGRRLERIVFDLEDDLPVTR